ncbi:MAG: protein translocase subunit SecD [Methyloligellaceae bacterium]
MLHFSPFKTWSVIALIIIGCLLAVPNMLAQKTLDGLPGWVPQNKLNLGLDLRGGSHLLLKMNVDELLEDWLETVRGQVQTAVRKVKVDGKRVRRKKPKVVKRGVQVRLQTPEHTDIVAKELQSIIQPLPVSSVFGTSGGPNLEIIKGDEGLITIRPTEAAITARLDTAINAAVETIRRRIDPNGTTEPIIQREGTDRILIQVPGLQDPQGLKKILGKTAKLSFHMVNEEVSYQQARDEGVPIGSVLVPDQEDTGMMHVLIKRPELTGDQLDYARPERHPENRRPILSFGFDAAGGRKFATLTQNNIGKRFAIVLDNGINEKGERDRKVLTAPTIQSAILGGQGIITGNFTVDETTELALLIKSGSLAASLQIVEEQSVGPSLGKESIEAGKVASIIGLIGVVIFILIAYGLFGVFANIALVVNLVLILGLLSLTQSTLTLPGIAGIVLTIGMAVDANVLIFERIREELRAGKTVVTAIDTGYNRAFGTILDANITTFIAAIILFTLGSGPIKGFAVTLSIGIATSVFTAFMVTRLMVITWLRMQKTRNIEAPI